MGPTEQAVAGAATGAGLSWAVINSIPAMFLGPGVSLVVVTMAATGALISFGIGARVLDRKQMFRMALVNTLLGAALTALMPAFLHWEWVTGALQPPLALGLALALRFIIPIVIDLAPAAARGVLKKFFGIDAPAV